MSTDVSSIDRFVPAREIKRRGIAAFDSILVQCPIFVVKNDRPKYVIMTEAHYQDLLEDAEVAESVRINASLKEARRGNLRPTTAEELMREMSLPE